MRYVKLMLAVLGICVFALMAVLTYGFVKWSVRGFWPVKAAEAVVAGVGADASSDKVS